MMTINPFIPVKQPNGNWRLERKEPSDKERQKFLVDAMKRIVEKGEVFFTADPSRIPAHVFQHTDMNVFKSNGAIHTALDMMTQKLQIALRYKDYEILGRDDTQVYMAIRVDIEKIVDIFDNLELKEPRK